MNFMKTKEERFKELIDCLYTGDYSIEIALDGKFKNFEIFNSKEQTLIEYNQKNKLLWVRKSLIWSVFEKEYNMKHDKIRAFMQKMLLVHLKINDLIPRCSGRYHND